MAWVTVTFNANGGTLHSQSPLYYAIGTQDWWTAKDKASQYAISSIDLPTWNNYEFKGFFTGSNGTGTKVCNAAGTLLANSLTSDKTVYASWTKYYTITLDKGAGASGGTSTIYYSLADDKFYADTQLTTVVNSVTPPTGNGAFRGYFYGGEKVIDSDGRITSSAYEILYTGDLTFEAGWFGSVVDYFNLGSATLIPMESDDGHNRPRVVTRIYGKSAAADQTGPVWRNPTVRYMVVGDMTLTVTLGKAFPEKTGTIYGPYLNGSTWQFGNHTGMTETGYMITSAVVETRKGEFPIVTVSAVANEGADAINAFAVSVPIVARARAQNLLGAFSGGGHLQRFTLAAACNPVVLQENADPCASDVVEGRYEANAEFLAPYSEAAPTCPALSGGNGGFTLIGAPPVMSRGNYQVYRANARREMY